MNIDKRSTQLRRHRVAAGIGTIGEFAKKVGVSKQAASLWELGRMAPSPERYARIAKVLGVTPMKLTEIIAPSERK